MRRCFTCNSRLDGWFADDYGSKEMYNSCVDIPTGFTDSDKICKTCLNNFKRKRDDSRIDGNCFFCKKDLEKNDRKFFKDKSHPFSEDFTFCDMACWKCVTNGGKEYNQTKKGPMCSKCGIHVEGYGHMCSICGIKVTYENQRMEKTNSSAGGWYVLSILLGLIGGLIGYVSLKNENPGAANNCVVIGVITSIIIPVIVVMLFPEFLI